MENSPKLAPDLLRGASAIAEYLGFSTRSIYSAAQKGDLPIRNVSGIGLVASKTALDKFFTNDTTRAEMNR